MKEEMRAVGYLCPRCKKTVFAHRSRFALAASGANIPCECGGSELQIQFNGENFHVSVPCGVCGGEHLASCKPSALLDGNGVGFACPDTAQLACFIGEELHVERAMEQLSITAAKEASHGEEREAFVDNVIMYEILSELRDIAARPHGIHCSCGSERYALEVRPAVVDLICKDCGGKLRIGAATDEDLDRLCCHTTLTIKGGKK